MSSVDVAMVAVLLHDVQCQLHRISQTSLIYAESDPTQGTGGRRPPRIGDRPKPFANITLRGAELGGLPLQCTDVRPQRGAPTCTVLSKALLTDVCFDHTTKMGPQYTSSDFLLLGQQTRCSSGVRVRLDRYSVASGRRADQGEAAQSPGVPAVGPPKLSRRLLALILASLVDASARTAWLY